MRSRRPDVPEELEAIVGRMLAKDPGRRYQMPAAVADALRPWMEIPVGPPTEAEMPRHGPLVRRLVQAGPPGRAFPVEIMGRAPAPAPGGPTAAPVAPRRRYRWGLAAAALGVVFAAVGAGWLLAKRTGAPSPEPQGGPSPRVISLVEAARHVGQRVSVVFTVRETGVSRSGRTLFLNSEADFKLPSNFAVVSHNLEAFRKRDINDPLSYFKGKTVRVVGTVSLYNERPQIVIADPGQVEVVRE
jgi:hypothetical protein